MNSPAGDQVFSGSIAQLYERYMVPLIFEPYAQDMARRVAALRPSNVLEIAAGTGAVTRHLADRLPADVPIVATDLHQPMLDHAMSIGTSRAVTWRQADAMQLPFDDHSFDAVVCQFGCMFLPDKVAGFAQARRVLRPGGTLVFNVWDALEDNEFADSVTQAMAELFPSDPPRFLARLPHGYHDRTAIAGALAAAGFTGTNAFDTVAMQSRADSARTVATAYCQGTPLRNEIETRDAAALGRATDAAAAALEKRFGSGPVAGKIQALVVAATRGAAG
jgi:SAM-dependent methyltransferase